MEHAVAEHYQGMPQLDLAFWPNLIFWLIVTMVVLYYVLSKIALPRIANVIADRHEAIANDLEAAADLKQKAEEAEAAYNRALADARADAQGIAAETRASIQKELDAALAKADAEIAARAAESEKRITEIKVSATASVQTVATDTAAELVKALMPGAADAKAVQAAIGNLLKG